MSLAQPNSFRNGPDERGHFGLFGGRFVAETLMPLILELEKAYAAAKVDPEFKREMEGYLTHYVGRPSPLYFAERLMTPNPTPSGFPTPNPSPSGFPSPSPSGFPSPSPSPSGGFPVNPGGQAQAGAAKQSGGQAPSKKQDSSTPSLTTVAVLPQTPSVKPAWAVTTTGLA